MHIPSKTSCELDFLALGALVHRLDPGRVPIRRARHFDVHVSGGEYNVAANLASCFGQRTGVATAMVRNSIGELIQSQVREMGVRPIYRMFDTDGVRGPHMAIVYSDLGQGVRPPSVLYNRAHEAAGLLQPGDFDWTKIFGSGVRWFHSGGIFASLSDTTPSVIQEAFVAARASGTVCSFDLNYRERLWKANGGPERGRQIFSDIVPLVDVVVGNEEDIQLGLGIGGPTAHGAAEKFDTQSYAAMIHKVVAKYPNIKAVAITLREVESANRHRWSALLWHEGELRTGPICQLDVLDRIGGGDGFAAGFIFGLLDQRSPDEALRLGWAHGALLTTYPGDVSLATLADVETFAAGGTARVQR